MRGACIDLHDGGVLPFSYVMKDEIVVGTAGSDKGLLRDGFERIPPWGPDNDGSIQVLGGCSMEHCAGKLSERM